MQATDSNDRQNDVLMKNRDAGAYANSTTILPTFWLIREVGVCRRGDYGV